MVTKRSAHRVPTAEGQTPVRARILEAAFSAFMERGFAATSTLEIATRARASKRELYAEFASKQDMLLGCIRQTADYARERQIFGKSVLDHQVVHFKLAELKTEVECLRALTYRACDLYVQGQDVLELASMAKLKAGRLNRLVPDTCLQFWGGMGYTWDNPASRLYRDGRLGSIAGGADEVMLGIIAKYMHTLPSRH